VNITWTPLFFLGCFARDNEPVSADRKLPSSIVGDMTIEAHGDGYTTRRRTGTGVYFGLLRLLLRGSGCGGRSGEKDANEDEDEDDNP